MKLLQIFSAGDDAIRCKRCQSDKRIKYLPTDPKQSESKCAIVKNIPRYVCIKNVYIPDR